MKNVIKSHGQSGIIGNRIMMAETLIEPKLWLIIYKNKKI